MEKINAIFMLGKLIKSVKFYKEISKNEF